MFNVPSLFGNKKKKRNKILDPTAQRKVNETKALLQKGDWSTAEILIDNLIRTHPHNADCVWLYGRLCANRGQYDAAIFHFKQCIKLAPTHSDCYCTYGATLGLKKKYKAEEEMYKKCLQLSPSHHLCHFNYGHLCDMRCDYKNAEKHFKQAIEGYSNDANYYMQYGKLLKNVHRYEEAQKNYEIAITIGPKCAEPYYLYSKLLQRMGNIPEAIKNLQKACRLAPDKKDYQRILHVLVRSKQTPRIRKSESLAVGMNVATINQTPSGSETSQSAKTLKKRSQTERILKLNDNPSMANDAYFKKAVELYQKEEYDEAEGILKLVISIKPNHEQAQRLYKYLSQKMYIPKAKTKTNKNKNSKHTQKPSHPTHRKVGSDPLWTANIKSRPRSNTVSVSIDGAESKDVKEAKVDIEDNDKSTKLDRDPCQIEFIRFLDDRVKLNKQYPDLYERFEKLGSDDIRFIFHFDIQTLSDEVNIKSLHCKMFMKKIGVFQAEANVFRDWLKRIVSGNQECSSMDGLIDRLENKGILTFEALYRYVLQKEDLMKIIGKEFTKIHHILWKEIENQQKDLIVSGSGSDSAPNPAFAMQTPLGPLPDNVAAVYPNNNISSCQQNDSHEGKSNETILH